MEEKKNLSIVLVSSYAFTHEPGGVKDFILGLKSQLIQKGFTVNIIAPGSKEAQRKGLVDFTLGRPFKISTDQTEFRASFSRKRTAKSILKKINPDIIVIHEPFVPAIGHTIISSIEKIKDNMTRPIIIGQFHASREDMSWGLKIVEFIGRHLVRRPKLNGKTVFSLSSGYASTINNNLDGRIAVSEATGRFWQDKFPSEYRVIHNGINTDLLTANGPRINNWLKDHKRIILFAGRHDSRKGIGDLINAFNISIKSGIDDIRLKITGKGEMTEDLRKMVNELGLQKLVEFVGVLPYPKLVEAYRTADVVVAPSTGGEGFNRTIIEARSCGCLVVCTNIEGQNEAIGKDLAPFMAKPRNPRNLARKIMEVLNLPEKKKQEIRKRGRDDVKSRFDWKNIAEEHINFYESMIFKNK